MINAGLVRRSRAYSTPGVQALLKGALKKITAGARDFQIIDRKESLFFFLRLSLLPSFSLLSYPHLPLSFAALNTDQDLKGSLPQGIVGIIRQMEADR